MGIKRIAASFCWAGLLSLAGRSACAQDAPDRAAAIAAIMPLILFIAFILGVIGLFIYYRGQHRRSLATLRAIEARLTAREALLHDVPLGRIDWPPDSAPKIDDRARQLLGETAGKALEAGSPGFGFLDGWLEDVSRPLVRAALERLQSAGVGFGWMPAATRDGRTLRLAGTAIGGAFHLWLDDVSAQRASITQADGMIRELSQVLDSLPYPVWRRNADLAITYCNKAFGQIHDLPPAEVVRQGREINAAAKALAKRAQKLSLVQSESQQLVVRGQRRLYDLNEFPLDDGSVIGFAVDQTALEDTHGELARHVAAHDDVLQSLGTGILIFGPDKRLKFFNDAYRGQFGLDAQFLSSEPTMDETLEALRDRRQIAEQADFRSYKQEFIRQVTTLIDPFEDLIHTPGGATFRMVATPHPFGGVTLIFEDVTDKLTLERNYNTLIEVQKETIDHLFEGIAVFGSDGRLKLHNPAFAKLWQIDPAELEGEPHVGKIVDLVRGFFNRSRDWMGLKQRIVSDVVERSQRDFRFERNDGKIIDVATIPLPDGGKLFKYADVTDSINMERALRERNEALIAADRLKSEFIANVSYEFRTPLNVIIGYAELLIREYFGKLNDRQKDYAQSVLDAAQGLLLMVGDVIDVAAIEAGYIRLDVTEFELKPVLESVMRLYMQRAGNRDLAFDLNIAPDAVSIRADEQRLKQALGNLISNAVGSAPIGSKVTLSAEVDGDFLCIAASQTGVDTGASQETEGTSFATDGSIGTSLGRSTTQGLGMALVKTLIELHGGQVRTSVGPDYRKVICRFPRKGSLISAAPK